MKAAFCAVALAAMALAAPPAFARVTRFEITARQPYGSFRAAEYVRLDVRVMGELAPDDGAIPDLDKPERNTDGMVDYATQVILFLPSNETAGNGALLVDVPNRGKPYAQALYNSPRGLPSQSGDVTPGTGYLEDQGYAVAEVQWELGQGAELPSFIDADGRRRFVEGTGFAIVRDVADFLAHQATDGGGEPNPLAGRISRTIGSGKSQDGRFLKTFLLDGFNQVAGRRVFDGMHVFVSAAGLLPIMRSGTGPTSSADGTPGFADPEFPGVNDGPLTIGEILARVEARGEIAPRMMLLNSTSDYLSLRASLGRTGASGTADLPLPANVRMYDVAGASHVTVRKADDCILPPNRLDWAPVARATLQRLDRWVTDNTPPPATTLMPLQPAIGDATVLQAPKALPTAVVQVPQRDVDGNPLGGVRLPDMAVPLGVLAAQNRPASFTCSLVGAFLPFAVTGDAAAKQPSLAERYVNQAGYVNRIRIAARQAVSQGFLLPEDAAIIIDAAAGMPILGSTASVTAPR